MTGTTPKSQKMKTQVLKAIMTKQYDKNEVPDTLFSIDYVHRSGSVVSSQDESKVYPWEHKKIRVTVTKLDLEGNPKHVVRHGARGPYSKPDKNESFYTLEEFAELQKVDLKSLAGLQPKVEDMDETEF